MKVIHIETSELDLHGQAHYFPSGHTDFKTTLKQRRDVEGRANFPRPSPTPLIQKPVSKSGDSGRRGAIECICNIRCYSIVHMCFSWMTNIFTFYAGDTGGF